MSLAVFHHGRPLSKEQLKVYSSLLAEDAFLNLSLRRQLAAFDKALAEAGMPVTPLKAGDEVSWNSKGNQDRGVIVSIDERSRKVRARSYKLHRDVTVAMDTVRVGDE